MIEVVGIGPGGKEGRTFQAEEALSRAEVIVGYKTYLALIEGEFPQAARFGNGMRGEEERCREAIAFSRKDKQVAVICSGDAQVYGMASLLLELSDGSDNIRVVPGVTAALSAAALLGAPLSGDFAVISLSDLLTPWDWIEKRLRAAAEGDFPIALYNPMSRTRQDCLARACSILMEIRDRKTPCGWAKNIGREGEEVHVTTLEALSGEKLDMFTTVIIGNSITKNLDGRLVTPRGYRL